MMTSKGERKIEMTQSQNAHELDRQDGETRKKNV
jgi:hypothetical protein